jgi:hypothetical protein
MELLVALARSLGFSLTAGVSLYATVAMIGLASRYGWVDLPAQFKVFGHEAIIATALVLYAIEFLADKIPWVDTMWDSVHTFIRPLGAALVAVAALGEASPALQGLVALVGGTIAAGGHFTKAGTRVIANTSPEPFSNWVLSLLGDGFVLGLGYLVLEYPLAALAVTASLVVVMSVFLVAIVRAARRRLFRDPVAASA